MKRILILALFVLSLTACNQQTPKDDSIITTPYCLEWYGTYEQIEYNQTNETFRRSYNQTQTRKYFENIGYNRDIYSYVLNKMDNNTYFGVQIQEKSKDDFVFMAELNRYNDSPTFQYNDWITRSEEIFYSMSCTKWIDSYSYK